MACQTNIIVPSTTSGIWESSCRSVHRGAAYNAKYYTFEIPTYVVGNITVTFLLSSTTDAYLYLLNGALTTSPTITYNDDGGGNANSKIVYSCAAGFYTLECTTYSSGASGSFILTVTGVIPPPPVMPTTEGPDDIFNEELITKGMLTQKLFSRMRPQLSLQV